MCGPNGKNLEPFTERHREKKRATEKSKGEERSFGRRGVLRRGKGKSEGTTSKLVAKQSGGEPQRKAKASYFAG